MPEETCIIMPYLPNGTFAESKEEWIERLNRENEEKRQEIKVLRAELIRLERRAIKLTQENAKFRQSRRAAQHRD